MALETNKKCIICGTKYRYCVNCKDSRPYQYWRNIYCSEECKAIGDLWYSYRGKEISKDDVKTLLDRIPDVANKIFAVDTIPAQEIKAIYDYGVKVEEPIVEVVEQPVEEPKKIEEVAEISTVLEPDVEETMVETVEEPQPKKSTKTNYNKNRKK